MIADALQIRPATPADLAGLSDLYQHLIADDARPDPEAAGAILARFLLWPGNAIFLGVVGGALVASCTLVVVPNLTRGGRPYALIENVVTRADHRQRGHGRRLLDHATAAAWQAGCYKIMLLTGTARPASTLRFYLDAGFQQTKIGLQKKRPTGL